MHEVRANKWTLILSLMKALSDYLKPGDEMKADESLLFYENVTPVSVSYSKSFGCSA